MEIKIYGKLPFLQSTFRTDETHGFHVLLKVGKRRIFIKHMYFRVVLPLVGMSKIRGHFVSRRGTSG